MNHEEANLSAAEDPSKSGVLAAKRRTKLRELLSLDPAFAIPELARGASPDSHVLQGVFDRDRPSRVSLRHATLFPDGEAMDDEIFLTLIPFDGPDEEGDGWGVHARVPSAESWLEIFRLMCYQEASEMPSSFGERRCMHIFKWAPRMDHAHALMALANVVRQIVDAYDNPARDFALIEADDIGSDISIPLPDPAAGRRGWPL